MTMLEMFSKTVGAEELLSHVALAELMIIANMIVSF